MSSTKDSKTAYVVPTILWDRITNELKELKEKHSQSGGAVIGLDQKGNVDAAALLKNFAIQQTIAQNPKSSVIGLLDDWTRQVMNDSNLAVSEKVHLVGSLNRAQQDQLKAARASTSSHPSTETSNGSQQKPSSGIRSIPSRVPPQSLPPPYETPKKSSTQSLEHTYDDLIKGYAHSIKELQSQTLTAGRKARIQKSQQRIRALHEKKLALRKQPKPKKLFSPS